MIFTESASVCYLSLVTSLHTVTDAKFHDICLQMPSHSHFQVLSLFLLSAVDMLRDHSLRRILSAEQNLRESCNSPIRPAIIFCLEDIRDAQRKVNMMGNDAFGEFLIRYVLSPWPFYVSPATKKLHLLPQKPITLSKTSTNQPPTTQPPQPHLPLPKSRSLHHPHPPPPPLRPSPRPSHLARDPQPSPGVL